MKNNLKQNKILNWLTDLIRKYSLIFLFIAILSFLLQSIYNPFFVYQEADYLFQPYDLRGIAKGLIYVLSYLVSILGIMVILGIKSTIIFGIFLFGIFVFYSIDLFVQLLGITRGFSLDKYILAMNEAGNYGYLESYIDYILYAFLLALLLISLLVFIRKKVYKKRYSSKWSFFVFISIISVYYASVKVSSIQLTAFPAFTKIPAIMILYRTKFKIEMKERVLDPNIKTEKEARNKNIIWIIDESITGSYLSINGYEKNTTPYLSQLLNTTNTISNYGIVNAVSNCSSPSNYYLRLGINPRLDLNIKQASLNFPTIYQYAKRAGYETWLYDSQAAKDKLQNNLSIYDVKAVDHFYTLDRSVLPRTRDAIFLDDVSKMLKDDSTKKKFIVLVKFGAHFPYLLSYDNSSTFFKPAMDVTYGGMALKNKEKLINTYLNSIRNNTDLYIKDLITKIDLSDTVVFYTSDHGQNILESSGKTTHCNEEGIVKNETTVPLLVLHENASKKFPINAAKNYSQIQMFPTTLSLMGYGDKVVDSYGVTLWKGLSKNEERKFFITYSEKIADYK